MDLPYCIDKVIDASDNRQKIEAARCLAPFTHDSRVMDALCEAAVKTTSQSVRRILMDVLKTNPVGAWSRFSDYALWSPNATSRKWALVNLGLMGCREAKDAVISGLHDPDTSVRKAAAMSTGLYDDKDVHYALAQCIEKHRLALTLAFIVDRLNAMGTRAARVDDDDVSTMTVLV